MSGNASMMDRASRDAAANLIEGFAAGRTTNRELEKRWPRTEDRGVDAAAIYMWLLYDDFKTHALRGANAESPEVRRTLRLLVGFLRSSLPYEYPHMHTTFRDLQPAWMSVLTLGLSEAWNRRIRRLNAEFEARMKAAGDVSVWPFARKEDALDAVGAAALETAATQA